MGNMEMAPHAMRDPSLTVVQTTGNRRPDTNPKTPNRDPRQDSLSRTNATRSPLFPSPESINSRPTLLVDYEVPNSTSSGFLLFSSANRAMHTSLSHFILLSVCNLMWVAPQICALGLPQSTAHWGRHRRSAWELDSPPHLRSLQPV